MPPDGGGFLPILDRALGEGLATATRYGGPGGSDGRGPPREGPNAFAFATGIECSNPTIAGPGGTTIRRDLLEECGHYARYREDLALVRDLGLRVLRYGLPWHRVNPAPGRFDWAFADEAMGEIRRLGITPILDLVHFGVPDWVGDFQNPELPVHVARHADAVAERYPWVRFWTPVNEIYVAAKFSAKEGHWNERLSTERGFVTALKHLAAAAIAGCAAVVRRRPDAVFVTAESAEHTHDLASAAPDPRLTLENRLLFASLDLLYGHPPDSEVLLYMMDNGLTREEHDWFMRGEPPGHQILGNDYYGRNERLSLPGGGRCGAEDVLGWYLLTKQYVERYRKPIMHTETNTFDAGSNPAWLWKQWANLLRMRSDGVPVLGFTWYSLVDQVDWDINLREKRGAVNACGLYDLDRKPRPVEGAYRDLLGAFGGIATIARAEMFELTTGEARLKSET